MTPTFSFNLVDEPWIPCLDSNGKPVELNLREVFAQAHQLAGVVGDSPPVTVALHRLLLAILHRVFGPEDEEEWVALWEADQWDAQAINAYLDDWRHRFDLFDTKHPFFQAADKRVKPKSVISLNHDRASGNNPTLFDHHNEEGGESLSPAQAARSLLTAQSFGLAGLSGITQKFTDGTCAGGTLFLIEGDSLRKTLLLNLIQYPSRNDHFQIHSSDDIPAWEMADPFKPERTEPLGYLDYLTWHNRRVLFFPERAGEDVVVRTMTMGPGLRYNPSTLNPMKNYRHDDKLGHIAISFSENRVFWRDSATLFTFSEKLDGAARPPANLRWLNYLISEMGVPDKQDTYRTQAVGMSKKQAKVFFFRQEQLPMPLAYLADANLVTTLHNALQKTGSIAFDLVQTARLMGMIQQVANGEENGWQKQWGGLNPNAKSAINDWIAHTGMERTYWSGLDIPFQSFIVDLAKDQEQALADWFTQLKSAAKDAFEQAAECVGTDGRSFKAVVRGRSYLNYRLKESLPNVEETQ